MTDAEQAFLNDLTELTKKHKIEIGGCGCCGSPWLTAKEDIHQHGRYIINKSYTQQVVFVEPDDYYWKQNGVTI